MAIKTWADKRTEGLFRGEPSDVVPKNVLRRALRKLVMLHAATQLVDLTQPPANRLEKLKGDRTGQHSIRINDQYRVCFVWSKSDAYDVEIVDYHWNSELANYGELEGEMAKKLMDPVSPGEVLKEEFLDVLGVSAYALAKALRVPTNRVTGIVNGERSVTADTALRLAQFFGTTPDFWMNLQSHYDLTVASRAAAAKIEKEVPKYAATA